MEGANKKNETDAGLSTSEMTKVAAISLRQLYYWEKKGLLSPKLERFGSREFRRYSKIDVDKLKKVSLFVNKGYTLDKAFEKTKDKK